MAWLNEKSAADIPPPPSPVLALEEVIRLVTWRAGDVGYDHIEVLVDGTDVLSSRAIGRFLVDVQSLYNLHLGGLDWKLFLDEKEWRDRVWKSPCVKEGRVNVTRLKCWRPEELRQVLRQRLLVARHGVTADPAAIPEPDFCITTYLARFCTPELRESWSEKIPDLETWVTTSAQGSPLRTVLLARALIARCARRGVLTPKDLCDVRTTVGTATA